MSFPEAARVELPILQELKATGGSDHLRYLYERLIRYFPQLTPQDLDERTEMGRHRWHRVVQRAGRQLEEKGELRREHTRWTITPQGQRRVEAEEMQVAPSPPRTERTKRALSHKEAQCMLVEIGQMLGRYAEAEFEHYDVVWRDSATAPRLS